MRFLCSIVVCLSFAGEIALAKPNTLTEAEKAAGWYLLFDGETLNGWKSVKKRINPEERWKASSGWLQCLGRGGGDIITIGRFEQFELVWEWKLEEGGNSGVKYFVALERGPIGHEYQILDNEKHPDGKEAGGKRLTAAFYDVMKCRQVVEPHHTMDVNRSRIVVEGNRVEHWLNGKRVLAYELGSKAVQTAVSRSKFRDAKDFGTRVPGHILLQDHGNLVWFRNIKIRKISDDQVALRGVATDASNNPK